MRKWLDRLLHFNYYIDTWQKSAEARLKVIQDQGKELTDLKHHPIMKLVRDVQIDKVDDPRESMSPSERKEYCARMIGMKPHFQKIIEWMIADQIKTDARSLFDPNRFHDPGEQKAFIAGNINMGDLLIDHLDSVASEHLENVRMAREAPPTSDSNPVSQETETAELGDEDLSGGLDLFGIVNNIK